MTRQSLTPPGLQAISADQFHDRFGRGIFGGLGMGILVAEVVNLLLIAPDPLPVADEPLLPIFEGNPV